ncbi:MAG: glycosyltransferase [Candidatus Omnitrophica bacterium]|nr:glycosyltransferase [Candidatus Omnitrophota bacterium]
MAKVSIIMNCHNGSQYLKESIGSVYAQEYKDWEIIFWDNASTDDSAKIAKSYDNRIKYFKSDIFDTLGIARNKAVEKATGQYLAFLDCDDLWMPNKLSEQIQLFNDDTVLVYSNYIAKNMIVDFDYVVHDPKKNFYRGGVTKHLCRNNFVGFQTAVIKIDGLKKLDTVFDNKMIYAPDYDLFLRLSFLGNFDYAKDSLAVYRKHQANFSNSRRHIIAHDFSYLLDKYKDKLDKKSLKGIARGYKNCLKSDLRAAGFRLLPAFLNLSFNPRDILISFVFLIFTQEKMYRTKDKLKAWGVFNFFIKLLYGIKPIEKGVS